MGTIKHDAIIVTGCDNLAAAAHAKALEIFDGTAAHVTLITLAGVNEYRSFMVAPDGSKEGWGDSDYCEEARFKFIDWLRSHGGYVDWVHVQFGGDNGEHITMVLDHGDNFP